MTAFPFARRERSGVATMSQQRSTFSPAAQRQFARAETPARQRCASRSGLANRSPETSSRMQPAVPVRSRTAIRPAQHGDRFAWSQTAVEGSCCWYRCLKGGQPFRVRGIFVNTVRNYCEHHVFSAEFVGLRLTPFELTTDESRKPARASAQSSPLFRSDDDRLRGPDLLPGT